MISKSKALVGALVTGAMAVFAAAPALAGDGFGYGGGHGRHGWNGGGNTHRAVEMCSRVAERQASRHAYGRARVTDIRDVRDTRWGFEVRGKLAVHSRNHGWRDNRWGYGYRDGYRNRDTGSFKCVVERGRVAYLDFDGIRGL
jgi:hypothetical protein